MSDEAAVTSALHRAAPISPTTESLRAHIAQLQEELVAQQRMALLGTMSAMVAHEFNNLMTPVVTRAQDALNRDDLPTMRKALDQALAHAQKAIVVARHLLGLADEGKDVPQACSVSDAVRKAVETLARPFDKDGIDLRVEVPADLRVRARPMLLEQLLLNLLLNAREAMRERGGALTICGRAEGDDAVIDVGDRGTGIPQQRLDEVVNPFLASEPDARPGDWHSVGMGLNVCRTIAHQHGARMRASANADGGCTFQIRWPAV
jgi:C4-dicarboxylate-specific signal transduction histidine kinase